MATISDYKKMLKELAEAESPEFVNNSSIEHAATMVETLFEIAKGKVSLFTGRLNSKVYGRSSVVATVQNFMDECENNSIDIIIQDNNALNDLKQNNLFDIIKHNWGGRVRLFVAKNPDLCNLKNHFMLVETKGSKSKYALRFETDTDKFYATGTFNAQELGEKLHDFFERVTHSTSVQEIQLTTV